MRSTKYPIASNIAIVKKIVIMLEIVIESPAILKSPRKNGATTADLGRAPNINS